MRDNDRRSIDMGCRGGPFGPPRASFDAPEWGAWQALRVLPRPLAGGQSGGGSRSPAPLFNNPVVGSHTRQVQAQCGSGRFHPRTWTLIGSREALYRPREGRYSEARSVARRVRLRLMGSWSASFAAESMVVSLERGARPEAGPDRRGQAPKGTGGMPRRHQMVGVEGRDRSGGAAQRASIPEFSLDTRGTETSQYPQEKKSTETPSVAASERGSA